MFATLQEASDWLAVRGVVRSPRQIIEDGAKGLVTIRAGLPDGAYIPWARSEDVSPVVESLTALMNAELGDTPSSKPTQGLVFGERPAAKGEMVALAPGDCVQFLQTNEAHIRGEGFADGAMTPDMLDEFGKVLTVYHVEAFRVQGEDLNQYASAYKALSVGDECMRYRATKTPAPLLVMATPGAIAPTRLERWRVATWRKWDAVLLVSGFDPDTYSGQTFGQGKPHCTGLCGGSFLGAEHFGQARKLLRIWEDDHPGLERTTPADFIAWCNVKGIDTEWLLSIETAEASYMPIEDAAVMIADDYWKPTPEKYSLAREVWRARCPNQDAPLESGKPCDTDEAYLWWAKHWTELDWQQAIDSLVAKGLVTLYTPGDISPTHDRLGALISRKELVSLKCAGKHLPLVEVEPANEQPKLSAPGSDEAVLDDLRWWFRLETWTLRDGFLLLLGLNPMKSEGVIFNDEGTDSMRFTYEVGEWRTRLGHEREAHIAPKISIHLRDIMSVWQSRPDHHGKFRFPPRHFIAWAQEKGFTPEWLQRAVNAELLTADGLEPTQDAAAPAQPPAGTGKVWTDERKAEARAYKKKNGLKKTAEHYKVSTSTISKHIPAGRQRAKKATPFGGLGGK